MRQLNEQDKFYNTDRNLLNLVREHAVMLFQVDIERTFQLEPAYVKDEYFFRASLDRRDNNREGLPSELYRDALLFWYHGTDGKASHDIDCDKRTSQRKRDHPPSMFGDSMSPLSPKRRKHFFDSPWPDSTLSDISSLTPRSLADVDDLSLSEPEVEPIDRKRNSEVLLDRDILKYESTD